MNNFQKFVKRKLSIVYYEMRMLPIVRMDPFRAAHEWGDTKKVHFPKYFTQILQWWNLTQLPKEDPKNIKIPWHTTWVDISSFFTKISDFCYIKKYGYRLHFNKGLLGLLIFLILMLFSKYMVAMLMMLAKSTT